VTRRRRHRSNASDQADEALRTSFLDVLSNGVGAAILLFLVFSIIQPPAKEAAGGSRQIRLVFQTADPLVVLALSAQTFSGQKATERRLVAFETSGRGGLLPRLTRHEVTLLGGTLRLFVYPREDGKPGRDINVYIESSSDECWGIGVRYVDRQHLEGWSSGAPIEATVIDIRGTAVPNVNTKLALGEETPPIRARMSSGGKSSPC
jgi:hypothetical protein